MKVRYVEAMIQPVMTLRGNDLPDIDNLCERVADVMDYLADYDDGESKSDAKEELEWPAIIKLARAVDLALDSFSEAMDEHSCDEGMVSPFDPVGSNEGIDTLMRREGFNSADMVAIVKLSDLETLIANQRSVA